MIKQITITSLLIIISPFLAAQEEPDHAIHEELRGLLDGIEVAINSEQYSDLGQYFHENLRITTINQEVMLSRDDIEPYFTGWFGEGGFLKKLDMKLEADALTEFYADKTIGIVRGSGDEDYVLADGRFFPMKTRWTATVIKDADGKWRILALHIGTNFLDNPLLTEVENAVKDYLIKGAIGGAVVGLLLGFLIGRRRTSA
jgi:ketosteroid isomerase-like protein